MSFNYQYKTSKNGICGIRFYIQSGVNGNFYFLYQRFKLKCCVLWHDLDILPEYAMQCNAGWSNEKCCFLTSERTERSNLLCAFDRQKTQKPFRDESTSRQFVNTLSSVSLCLYLALFVLLLDVKSLTYGMLIQTKRFARLRTSLLGGSPGLVVKEGDSYRRLWVRIPAPMDIFHINLL